MGMVPAMAQEPILTFDVESGPALIEQGGTATVKIEIRNDSIREADDIALSWLDPEAITLAEPFETIKVLAPFSSTSATIVLSAGSNVPLGEMEGSVDVVYTYCIGDLCFQVVDAIALTLRVESAAAVVPQDPDGPTVEPVHPDPPQVESSQSQFPWSWILGGFVTVCLAGALWLWRTRGDMRPAYAALVLVAGVALAFGVTQQQHEQARSIGSVLCLSCVGIEVASEQAPSFGASSIARIESIDEPVEIWVFFAVWCKTCPYAEAMVELAASYNPEQITYRFVDVERDPALAVEHGVVDTGRTVVPAVLRVDTGEVIFGTERLEGRLLALLEGGE